MAHDFFDSVADDAMNEAVGAEVRRRRELAGWSRPKLIELLPFPVHVQQFHYYESGGRPIPLGRLVEICRVLGTTAPEVIRIAVEQVEVMPTMAVQIDLLALLDNQAMKFEPVRTWARNKLGTDPGGTGTVAVHHAVIREWAVLLGVSLGTVVRHLVATSALRPISS